jgi:hypothetical protein
MNTWRFHPGCLKFLSVSTFSMGWRLLISNFWKELICITSTFRSFWPKLTR